MERMLKGVSDLYADVPGSLLETLLHDVFRGEERDLVCGLQGP